MAGTSMLVAREVIAEPPVVWQAFEAIDRFPRVLTSVEKIERTAGAGIEVGAAWLVTRRFFGRTEVHEMRVTAVEPGRSIALESKFGDSSLTITYRVKPSSLGTRIEAEVEGETASGGRLGRLLAGGGGAAVKAARDMLEQDIQDIASAFR